MSRDRVLDPDGALPAAATRLDPVGPTRPDEQVLALDALVLGPTGADLARAGDGAALTRAMEDRGGLPEPGWDGALVGRVEGHRVVLLGGLAGIPVWARPRWHATQPAVVHLEGHAVVGRTHQRWVTPRAQDPLGAVAIATADHVRAVVHRLAQPLVVLGEGPLVHAAVVACETAGNAVVATARTLAEAQALDAAGARVLVDLGGTPAAALATLQAAAARLPGRPGVLLLGALPPVRVGPDGASSDAWPRLAGMLGPRVDVVGSVDVGSIVTGTGATVVLHGVAEPRRRGAEGADGWA